MIMTYDIVADSQHDDIVALL